MKNRKHRLWVGLNTSIALLLAIAIVLMVNYLSFRHYHREDWSSTQRYKLSSKTIGLLDHLDRPIDVTVFFQPGNPLYRDIHNLLREYQFHNDRLFIQWVDPDRDLGQTEELAVKYEVSEPNLVVFDCEGRSKYVRSDEIAMYALNDIERITAFNGEQAFSSAIQEVFQEDIPVIYTLTGHGEHDMSNFDPHTGFSRVAQLIERDHIEIKPLLLSTEKKIPSDCAVLIIANASQSMSKSEADLIGTWLHHSGRLMVLTDAGQTSGLESLLCEWGVLLRDDVVFDPDRTLTGREVFTSTYSHHPITEKLNATAAIFYLPRSVEPYYAPRASADRPQVTPLAFSSKKSWSETHLEQNPAKYNKNTDDLFGPISMAVAVEKGAVAGPLKLQIHPTRIVIFGDSDFISNRGLTGADISLFMSALNWLLDREQLMEIAPKQVDDTRLKLTRDDLKILFWSVIGVLPASVALLGIVFWIRRRE